MAALYPRLWRFALVLTRDRAAADDLAQKTCERALSRTDQFAEGTHLDRWVFTLARRIWLNELRAGAVRRGAGVVPVEEIEIADEKPDAETNIFASEVLTRVQALPEAQRMAMVLVYVEGYTYGEVAEMMDVPVGTIMSRLAAARKRVAKDVTHGSD